MAVPLCADLMGKEKGEAVSCRSKKPSLPEQQKGSVFACFTRKAMAVFSSRHLATSRLDEAWEYFLLGNVFAALRCQGKVSEVVALCRANHSGSQCTSSANSHIKTTWAKTTTRGSAQGSLLGEEQEGEKKKKSFK